MAFLHRPGHGLIPLCLMLVLGLGCGLVAHAGAAKKAKIVPPVDDRILVTAVDLAHDQITIVFKRSGQKTSYTVDDFSQVTFQNSPGSIKDIKVGNQIFSYVERDGHTLDSLTVGTAELAPSAAKAP
jgi:hypothetical protein